VAELRPFRGIRYNQGKIKDISAVICPPHDIIPPHLQEELYHRHENNFVRIEFGRELPQDNGVENRYTRAVATIESWLEQGILQPEARPAIYIHDYYFNFAGRKYRRRGLIATVRLEDWDKRVIFPHEGTLARSKNDRLNMLRACQANTSPILALYQDREQVLKDILDRATAGRPIVDAQSEDERHVIWAVDDLQLIGSIRSFMVDQPLYIADGHHRYESALIYKKERAAGTAFTGEEGFNFIMMTLVEFDDPGLLILPPHRLVRGISRAAMQRLKESLGTFFHIEEISLDDKRVWQRLDEILVGGLDHVHLGLFGLQDDVVYILAVKDQQMVDNLMPAFHSDIYRRLDVSVVDHLILEELLNLGNQGEQAVLTYNYDRQDAVNRVRDGEFQLAILLNPVKAAVIKAIADAGDRMPRKSTYFYPKEPAGLVFYRMVL